MFFLGAAGIQFVDRGSLDVDDFVKEDLTEDGNWHDMDLSGIVGAGRRLVQIYAQCNTDGSPYYAGFRTKGHTGTQNRYLEYNVVGAKTMCFDTWIYTDANGFVQYRFQPTTWTIINIAIRGWFKL